MSRAPSSTHAERTPTIRRYTLQSGITVTVSETEYGDSTPALHDRCLTVFLPGWAMEPHSKSVETISTAFAEHSGEKTVALTSRTTERGTTAAPDDLLMEEARAIAAHIQDQGMRHIIVAGHSQGADKAVNVVTLLQDSPAVSIDGLILINPVGLYERSARNLAKNYIENSTIGLLRSIGKIFTSSPKQAWRHVAPAIQAGKDVASAIAHEMRRSKFEYIARFKSEVAEMARMNPHLRDVTVPVVVVTGMSDSVSQVHHIAPQETQDAALSSRETYLKEHVLPKSPYVRMLVPRTLGVHSLPFLRPNSVAKNSLDMLRYYKEHHDTFIKTE